LWARSLNTGSRRIGALFSFLAHRKAKQVHKILSNIEAVATPVLLPVPAAKQTDGVTAVRPGWSG
jgi:hypothetical protein